MSEDTYDYQFMKRLPVATWNVSIYTDCPSCKETIDVCDHETFYLDHPNLELASNEEIEVTCPLCNYMFDVKLEW